MTAYLLLPLIQTLFSLVLIIVVLKGHFQSLTHRLFSLFLLGLAIWGVMIFGMRASPDIEHAYSWEKWLVTVAPFTSVLFYHFAIRYTATRVKHWLLPFLYIICFLFIALAATRLLVSGMQMKPFGYAPVFGPAGLFNVLFTLGVSLMAFLTFVRIYRTSAQADQKNRAAYIITAMIFSLLGAVFDILTALGLPLYPGMIVGSIIFCLLTTVAIVRYNLLDIQVVLRKSIAYILMSALIAIPFVGIFLLVTSVFVEQAFPSWAYFVLAIILALVLPHLWQRVQRGVDKWFYRDRYDYLKALETFSQETQSITDSVELGSTMVNLLTGALRTSSVHLLQPLAGTSDFAVSSSTSANSSTASILLNSRGPLVKWLKRHDDILAYEDLSIFPQLQTISPGEIAALERVRAELIVPLKAPTGQLSGVLILGKKLSEQPYTLEDKQLIYTICNQMATNLENAWLYAASQQEVAERKRMEEALRESKELFEKTFTSQRDAIFILDAKNPPTILDCNPAALETFGYSRQEVLGHTTTFLHVDEAALRKFQEYLYPAVEKRGFFFLSEFAMKRKDGTVFPTEHSVVPLKEQQGKRIGWVSVVRDITERKQVEEREKQLQQELYLSSRLASIGELAAGVAHQINNPLTGILGFSQRLLRKSTDGQFNRSLERIHIEAQRAAKIVQNLLTFARRREPKKEYSDLNDILQSALELRAYELTTSNIEVVTDLTPNLPQIMADFHQMQEVFLNIILNAEQAMTESHSSGRLTIKTEERKGYIRTTFTDDGPGIPAEHLDKIFDPFFSTRGERGGTGLGLSVCHGIVTEHGGRIYVKSKLGKGATFFVELPLVREEKEASKVVYKRKPTLHKIK
jgi:PAS domain S-box-containing protein